MIFNLFKNQTALFESATLNQQDLDSRFCFQTLTCYKGVV